MTQFASCFSNVYIIDTLTSIVGVAAHPKWRFRTYIYIYIYTYIQDEPFKKIQQILLANFS